MFFAETETMKKLYKKTIIFFMEIIPRMRIYFLVFQKKVKTKKTSLQQNIKQVKAYEI